ncbi:hypothetical protein [Yoonia sp. R2-816]|uniref:hypothetical protein n=1 Tax=Yoonia sp. R2-816 TaxID=3342638 RepID=UPI003727A7E2
MTKFKGQVASIAPNLSVVVTLAMLFAGSATQSVVRAQSTDSRPSRNGQGDVACAVNSYLNSIAYAESDVLNLIHNDAGTVAGEDDVSIEMNDGTVSIAWPARSANPFGRYAKIDNETGDFTANVEVTGGIFKTSGDDVHGISARTAGHGNTTARMIDGTVKSGGVDPNSIVRRFSQSAGINQKFPNIEIRPLFLLRTCRAGGELLSIPNPRGRQHSGLISKTRLEAIQPQQEKLSNEL